MPRMLLLGAGLAVLLGMANAPSQGQQKTERRLPISKDALLGKWEGKASDTTVYTDFGEERVELVLSEVKDGRGRGRFYMTSRGPGLEYAIDRKAGVVKIGLQFGEGRLVEGGALRLTLLMGELSLPKGATVLLRRTMPDK